MIVAQGERPSGRLYARGCAEAVQFADRVAVSPGQAGVDPTTVGTIIYHVQRRRTSDPDVTASYMDAGTTTSNSFVDGELPNGVSFTYRVRTEDPTVVDKHSPWEPSGAITAVNCPAVANT